MALLMFLEVSATLSGMPMTTEGKLRAAQAVADAVAARGWNAVNLADAADIPDAATVRTFMDGETWPWPSTRSRIEKALGLDPGILDRIAKGATYASADELTDPIEKAIGASRKLTKGQKHRLLGQYADMIEGHDSTQGQA